VVVPAFYAVALAAAAWLTLTAGRRGTTPAARRPIPGMLPFVLFGLWTMCVTATGALFFAGTPVLSPSGEVVTLGAEGLLSVSNLAQLTYMWLGIAVVVIVARSSSTGIGVVGLSLAVATLLSFWALLHRDFGAPFPVGFFDNSPSFRYIESTAEGIERFRGITAEPSALSAVSIPTLVFLVAYFPQSSGWRRAGALLLGGVALWNGLASTSTSFFVSGVVMLGVALVVFLIRYAVQRLRVRPASWVVASAVVIALVFVLPGFMNFVAQVISNKVESSSYEDRSGADAFSFDLALQTLGIGVGLGSNRPSSFVAALLSQTGVIGLALFAIAVGTILRSALPIRAARPVLWVAVSIIIGKVYNGPDLGDSTGLPWLALGVLAHYALRQTPVAEDDPVAADPLVPARPPLLRSPRREVVES
jgi:hypothetical protein